MGTHLRVLGKGYPMNTNMTGFRWFSNLCVFVLWTRVAPALEWLKYISYFCNFDLYLSSNLKLSDVLTDQQRSLSQSAELISKNLAEICPNLGYFWIYVQ